MTEELTEGKSLDQELAEANAKIRELEEFLQDARRNLEAKTLTIQNINLTHRQEKANWKEQFAPLAATLLEIILEDSKFDDVVKDIVYDKVRDMLDDRDFDSKVADVVSSMSFEVSVR